jgi:hypothetical protein
MQNKKKNVCINISEIESTLEYINNNNNINNNKFFIEGYTFS